MSNDLANVQLRAEFGPGADSLTPAEDSAQLQVCLTVVSDRDGGAWASVVASGEIDVATVGLMRAATLAVAPAPHPRGQAVRLLLDWEGVTFLDCSGVHLLQDLHARGIEQGSLLQWIPPSAPGPARLLRLAADQGWLPAPLAEQLAARSRSERLPAARAG